MKFAPNCINIIFIFLTPAVSLFIMYDGVEQESNQLRCSVFFTAWNTTCKSSHKRNTVPPHYNCGISQAQLVKLLKF